jgi:glycyl-tRNA synthetase
MAHYASDCWDAEIRNSYGWTECVGIADRSAFDLTEHSRATKVPLSAFVEFSTGPREVESVQVKLDKGKIGKTYKDKAQILIKELSEMDSEKAKSLEGQLKTSPVTLTIGNNSFEVTKDIVSFENAKKRVIGEHIIPGVIEPSFGIGRILYSILEHNYYTREGSEQRAVLSLPPQIAPVKVSVLPLISSPELLAFVPKISTLLNLSGISHKVDDIGATIGKRYARTDEIGIPFGITIDKQTVSDSTVTLRERDSMAQIRIPIADIPSLIQSIVWCFFLEGCM